jgi:cobalt-zinc-cadmium efflux system outer membrane protein
MKKCRLIFAFLLGVIAGSCWSTYSFADNQEAKLTKKVAIADLVNYAYLKNPSIEAAREEWRAAIEKFRIVTGYPDPLLSLTYFPEPIETRLGPQDWNLSLSQMIPFPGKLSKSGDVAEAEARLARLKLGKTVRDVIISVRESCHELLYIRNAKRVVNENLRLLNHLRKVGETAYAEDRTILMDMIKAQSQLGQLRYDILLLEELEETEKTRLNSLLDRKPDAEIGELEKAVLSPVVFDLGEIYQLAEKNQEEILMAETKLQKAEAKVELAHYKNMPDFKIGLFYGSIGNPDVMTPPTDAGRDAVGIQVGMTLPFWFEKNKGRKERARAEMRTAKAEKKVHINKAHEEIRALFFHLKNARRLMELYREELIPQAASAMELAEVWFREGESSFSDFVETQSVWYNFQLSLVRAQADYGKYLARLERLVGKSLTHREERFEEKKGNGAKE